MKQKKTFTLIEILTVIAVIGILAGLIFPALLAVQNNSRRTKTETILTGVNTAIRVFKGDYNMLPTIGGTIPVRVGAWGGNIDRIKPTEEYYTFFDILTYKDHSKNGSSASQVSDAVKDVNTKANQYLDPPPNYFKKDDNLNSVRDAWNRPIVVFLDDDADGTVEVESSYAHGDDVFGGDSVAISLGNQNSERFDKADKAAFITIK